MIVGFYVYDAETGEILRTGHCPTTMVSIQASEPGEVAVKLKKGEPRPNDREDRVDPRTRRLLRAARRPSGPT